MEQCVQLRNLRQTRFNNAVVELTPYNQRATVYSVHILVLHNTIFVLRADVGCGRVE